MQIKNFLNDALSSSTKAATTLPTMGHSTNVVNYSEEVQPVIIRKTPKFLTRERQLAIRRRKPSSPDSSQQSESLNLSIDSDEFIDSDESINDDHDHDHNE